MSILPDSEEGWEGYNQIGDEYQRRLERAEAMVASGERSQRDCDYCGEPLGEEIGEFYDPNSEEDRHYIAHAQCGLDQGWEIA